ncbi:MAG: twin-arginine translocation signal domain-containing protein, partial [Alphaproteobacteria bacterium]
MSEKTPNDFDRRKFLAGVAVSGAAAVSATEGAKAALLPGGEPNTSAQLPSATRPSYAMEQAESGVPADE